MFDEKIGNKFGNNKAWAVCTMYHGVIIGKWDGKRLNFHKDAEFSEDCVTEMRVFNNDAELRFVKTDGGIKERYITDGANSDVYDKKYLVYGTDYTPDSGGIFLTEERGGKLWFPAVPEFADGKVNLWLGIRNYLKYNPVSIGDDDTKRQTGKPALEVTDYRYFGFYEGLSSDGTATTEVLL
ncbi:MAG: hypothetical protein LBN99_04680 [Oscillospiraceae bacterium]|jgi:CRISPR-associated protein (TIGR03984 family)|nr:hypothetical protein [Oscillospiraceae bacterium]